MHFTREIAQDIHWVGGSDRRLERFENLFPLPDGVTYNSFVILDEKTALLDTVDITVSRPFLDSVAAVLNGRPLDYLVVNHMEPDHCAAVAEMCLRYPKMKVVGNQKTFQMVGQFFEEDLSTHFLEVAEGDELKLGQSTLRFYFAPMVHWPEVMFTYETSRQMLFSADAFGGFGAFSGTMFNDETDYDYFFLDEARRYYANIVGKYGAQVQNALKKLADVPIRMICPLHGPIFRSDISYIMGKYDLWSRWQPEQPGVVIAYGSMYGNTENAAQIVSNHLAECGVREIQMFDISKTHPSYIVASIFKYSHLLLAAPTYNMGLYMPMETLLADLASLNMQNRKVAIIGNGTWAPAAPTLMKQRVEGMKNMQLLCEPVVIKSSLRQSQHQDLLTMAQTICASVLKETAPAQ